MTLAATAANDDRSHVASEAEIATVLPWKLNGSLALPYR